MLYPRNLPLLLLMVAITCFAPVPPAILALVRDNLHDARSFFYAGLLGLIVTALVAVALANRPANRNPMRQLVSLLAIFAGVPFVMAVPFHQAVQNTSFLSAYFEMVSSFTTTGATLYDPDRLSMAEHLWRAQVGWLGGLVMWVAAAAILAPLTLGGFEITARGEPGQIALAAGATGALMSPHTRLWRSVEDLVPLYVGLTLALALLLLVAGDPPLIAVAHAMAVLSTSGISPTGTLEGLPSGFYGEAILAFFLLFALSRLTFSKDIGQGLRPGLYNDPEFRLGLIIAVLVPLILFLRQWVAAFDVGTELNFWAGLRALWGGFFTALSFLTTTGFTSSAWTAAQDWSGLSTPGIILMGVALVGGGVATTAGGVKLLRVFALYLTMTREVEKLVHPSSLGTTGALALRIRREGAFIAWVSFMMFALTLAALSVLFGLMNVAFETGLVLSIAALANTGPLVLHAISEGISLIALEAGAKLVMCFAMVLGRLELLAFVVMLSPDVWRD